MNIILTGATGGIGNSIIKTSSIGIGSVTPKANLEVLGNVLIDNNATSSPSAPSEIVHIVGDSEPKILIEDRKHPYFDLKNGCSTTIIPHHDFLEGALKNLWFTLCGMKFDTQLVEPINKTHKKRLLEQLLFYYQLHLQNFKMPKSITILHELFK